MLTVSATNRFNVNMTADKASQTTAVDGIHAGAGVTVPESDAAAWAYAPTLPVVAQPPRHPPPGFGQAQAQALGAPPSANPPSCNPPQHTAFAAAAAALPPLGPTAREAASAAVTVTATRKRSANVAELLTGVPPPPAKQGSATAVVETSKAAAAPYNSKSPGATAAAAAAPGARPSSSPDDIAARRQPPPSPGHSSLPAPSWPSSPPLPATAAPAAAAATSSTAAATSSIAAATADTTTTTATSPPTPATAKPPAVPAVLPAPSAPEKKSKTKNNKRMTLAEFHQRQQQPSGSVINAEKPSRAAEARQQQGAPASGANSRSSSVSRMSIGRGASSSGSVYSVSLRPGSRAGGSACGWGAGSSMGLSSRCLMMMASSMAALGGTQDPGPEGRIQDLRFLADGRLEQSMEDGTKQVFKTELRPMAPHEMWSKLFGDDKKAAFLPDLAGPVWHEVR
ncbi:hypothetical protein HYH03_013462 [Edaphochlamys debaryana]|uniref:Uncharacterized protein n=1 Tax=Edaphochlamys debaryana TaxID=47281 RepID=A0A835XW28_9CHLO|nr:hypothetical protein HYH03_013462 [Edaphochlamys debaryana]|eukprot:KAG2487880.1 hypothetical protein HYH03_013462 [Edaphochlamys debaryana]